MVSAQVFCICFGCRACIFVRSRCCRGCNILFTHKAEAQGRRMDTSYFVGAFCCSRYGGIHGFHLGGRYICRTYTRPDDDKFEFRHRRRKPRGYEYVVPRSCFAYGCGNGSVLRICFFNEKNLVQASRKTAHRIFGTCKTSHGSFLGTSYAFRRRGVRYKKAFSSKALCGLC